jgi:hypothetical protein
MIITQKDVDEFQFALEDHFRSWRPHYNVDTHDLDQKWIMGWLSENPQVVVAHGYQEFVAGSASPLYHRLVNAGQLDDLERPLFREFNGSWIVPAKVGVFPDEKWDAFRLDGLVKLLDIEERRFAELPDDENDNPDYSKVAEIEAEYWRLESESHTSFLEMPSFNEMVNAASRLINNPLADATTFVSPKLWTPGSQASEKLYLQDATRSLITSVQSGQRELADVEWNELEEIVAEVLRSKGMEIHRVTENPQGGRDIIGRLELIGGDRLTIAVEVKHRKVVGRPILATALQQNKHFPALMLVTSGRFSAGVIKEAARPETRLRVSLKDGVALRDMIHAYPL